MTSPVIAIGLGLLAGLAIGMAFFAGLWLTVRQVAEQGKPRSFLLVSFAIRTILAVGLLALLARQGVLPLLGAVAGFVASRVVVTRLVGRGESRDTVESPDAPSVDAHPDTGAAPPRGREP